MLEANDIARLAAMCNSLRPDWPQASIYTFIAKNLSGRGLRDVAVALAWVATDPASSTPKRVLEAGPWWQAAALGGASTQRPPRWDETCPHHPANYRDGCAGCRADQLAGETAPPARAREASAEPPDMYRKARLEARKAAYGQAKRERATVGEES